MGTPGILAPGFSNTQTLSTDTVVSTEVMLQDKTRASPYPNPTGFRNGFDSLDMHEVWVTQQSPAIRVKLEKAGKPQAAQLDDGTILVAGFIEPPVHKPGS